MLIHSVYCISGSRGRADSILVDLRDDGIRTDDISVLFLDPDHAPNAAPGDAIAPVPPSAGPIRGVVAMLGGAERVDIPHSGPMILSGALLATAREQGATSLGELLFRFAVPRDEVVRIASQIMAGQFFVAVQSSLPGACVRAGEIFAAGRASDICTKIAPAPSEQPAGSGPLPAAAIIMDR